MPDLPSTHANRHAWAVEKHGHLLAEALRKDSSAESRTVEKLPEQQIPAHIVSLILERADPTQNKGMTAWLVGQYAQGDLRLEDLGTANETLTMFRRYAPRLEIGQRDLGQYQSLAAVWEAVIAFANAEEHQISGKAQKALDRVKAYAESRILRQDPDGFTIAVPLTEFAAKWWGKGTRWCTAAEKDNQFWSYHEKAPLIVMVIPELKEKGKFQMWASKKGVQLMDAADCAVSDEVIDANWWRLKPLVQAVFVQNTMALNFFPKNLRNEVICRIAVGQNGGALRFVPKNLRTMALCMIAVGQDGLAIDWVPEHLRTVALCRIAVEQNGEALGWVPGRLRTSELYRIAVTQNGKALAWVPKELRTEILCYLAVTQNGWALIHVPEALRTEELCRIAVAQKGGALEYVPEKLRTEEMCRIAVAQHGRILYFVPRHLATKEVCEIAVAQDGAALAWAPHELHTEKLCNIAVTQAGVALCYVSRHLQTGAMCKIAVKQNGRALQWVPQDRITFTLCKIAIQNTEEARPFIPFRFREKIDRLHPPKPLLPTWDLKILDEIEHGLVSAVMDSVVLRHE
jgi:hypothetical protein